ncbi:hypothetical protein DEO72_LG1g2201 [Vigna unguiculata]|uniref:Uncharacterized protein n=1 Tax=Vigna unguiculata TaxID=3917 RepID=A0A4D6KPQ2_VIGUN|nr:hypothetical protein DEO72_LG1g2201 [Vigna unguiculata]
MVGGIPMETVREVREDPPEELAESNWPAKGGYGWVAADVHNQSSLFRLSRAGAGNRKVLLHVHVPLLSVTCVVAAGRLHHGPRQSITWLSLISRPSINRLVVFSQSFKHVKDRYFKVVVKEEAKSHFLNADGSTKFPFSWTRTPSRYKDMGTDKLSAEDKEVVETLMKFTDKLPTKGLIRVYNSVHPIIDIEDTIINSINGMEADHIVRTMVEFGSKALILSHRVGSLYRWEVKEGCREKVEELQGKVDKLEDERVAWKKERESWEEERKRLGTWKVRCLDSERKLNKKIEDLEADYEMCIRDSPWP